MFKATNELILAQQFITASLIEVRLRKLPIAVAIVDAHGELMSFVRTDECALHAGVLAPNKAYTAARGRQKSSALGQWANTTGKDMGYWTDSRITGCVPITLYGNVIGGIGISGLSENKMSNLHC
ncbi:GlcG/HbpS family heme-binding protein [Paraglaciecola psychrophila]|uniref:GlcG protein n=1 Tax=Paraglaciecola psychrophila 170 TaxID=1129794 RepID=K6ZRF4_9ALTE|nr:heme-binding protein [Paraglaciecola psychrophila]AGH46768.1 hypothetical protein C427_4669 [Paraglaciecola psychrophila 170]GAC38526.1 glc operon protein GlcG [Paraglaciecola psychrophila 170]